MRATGLCILIMLVGLPMLATAGAPIENVENMWIPAAVDGNERSIEDVRQDIMIGCIQRGWTPEEVAQDAIRASILVRGRHYAEVDILFTERMYSITYRSSRGLEYDEQTSEIHANYNKWVWNLAASISQQLALYRDSTASRGGERVSHNGVSFALPPLHKWKQLGEPTGTGVVFGDRGTTKGETLVLSYEEFPFAPAASDDELLERIRKGLPNGQEGSKARVETQPFVVALYEERAETCAIYRGQFRDYGQQLRDDDEYLVGDVIGMMCVDPRRPDTLARIELSRRALPGMDVPTLETDGRALFRSVAFDQP